MCHRPRRAGRRRRRRRRRRLAPPRAVTLGLGLACVRSAARLTPRASPALMVLDRRIACCSRAAACVFDNVPVCCRVQGISSVLTTSSPITQLSLPPTGEATAVQPCKPAALPLNPAAAPPPHTAATVARLPRLSMAVAAAASLFGGAAGTGPVAPVVAVAPGVPVPTPTRPPLQLLQPSATATAARGSRHPLRRQQQQTWEPRDNLTASRRVDRRLRLSSGRGSDV